MFGNYKQIAVEVARWYARNWIDVYNEEFLRNTLAVMDRLLDEHDEIEEKMNNLITETENREELNDTVSALKISQRDKVIELLKEEIELLSTLKNNEDSWKESVRVLELENSRLETKVEEINKNENNWEGKYDILFKEYVKLSARKAEVVKGEASEINIAN